VTQPDRTLDFTARDLWYFMCCLCTRLELILAISSLEVRMPRRPNASALTDSEDYNTSRQNQADLTSGSDSASMNKRLAPRRAASANMRRFIRDEFVEIINSRLCGAGA
jgi:hypothetical protein